MRGEASEASAYEKLRKCFEAVRRKNPIAT